MRKQCILLEHRIQVTLVRRKADNILSVKDYLALCRFQKACQNTKQGRLATAGRSEQGYKFILVNVQIDAFQYNLSIKFFYYILKLYQLTRRSAVHQCTHTVVLLY